MTKDTKCRIIKAFGLGTYKGIYKGYLKVVPLTGNGGVIIKYTDKKLGNVWGKDWFHSHQYNPFLNIKDYQ